MSKRFGRNQKRKMKEQIETANAIAGRESELRHELEMIGDRNRRIVKDTARILGNYFISLEPSTKDVRYIHQLIEGIRIPKKQSISFDLTKDFDTLQQAFFVEQVLPVIYGSTHRDDLMDRIHYRIEYKGKKVGYALDQKSMDIIPNDLLIDRIARTVAECFVERE
jgi:hypothetical protein